MRFEAFDWDAWNVEHIIARHGVAPNEVEAICRSTRALILRGREGRYLVYGFTESGRYLLSVLRSLGGGRVRVITSRDMTSRERQFYRERRR